jgi:hypothetical protein
VPTTEITITVIHENDIPAGSKQIAADMAAQAAADSFETSGGGEVRATGASHDPE